MDNSIFYASYYTIGGNTPIIDLLINIPNLSATIKSQKQTDHVLRSKTDYTYSAGKNSNASHHSLENPEIKDIIYGKIIN